MNKIASGIVLFNPDNIERLNESLKSVLCQVERVYIFDNSSKQHDYSFPSSVIYITEHTNKGIAYALNRIMERALSDGYDWVVTMDQDSILPDDTIKLYTDHINDDSQIAIICPQVIDLRRSYMEVKKEPQREYINFCITSASCTKLSAWKRLDGFDEWLFVDLVDNEYCRRLIVSGYKILRLNELVLDQEFGRIIPKNRKIQMFWNKVAKILHNQNFAKFGYSKFVSPLRVYYTCRNIIYVNKKLKNCGKVGYEDNYNCKGFLGFLVCFVAPSILRAQSKGKVLRAVFKGLIDGIKSKPELWRIKGIEQI